MALGERVLTTFKEPGAEIIAEDLGIVPDYVRESMAALGVPGSASSAGNAGGTRKDNRSAIRRTIRLHPWPRRARTTPSRS